MMRAIGNTSVDYYYYPRELWTVEGLVNNRGHEVEHYTYDAYGLPVIKSVDYRDVNYDGLRDVADRELILTKTGQAPCTAGPIYDLQGDGDIDSSDAYVAYTLWEQQQSYRALVSLTTSGITNPYLFTGQPLDVLSADGLPQTYLYHYRARAYDPTHGRFMQRDHYVEYNDGLNSYQYTRSSPTNFIDWNGKATGYPAHDLPDMPPQGQICCDGPGCCGWNQPISQPVQQPPSSQQAPESAPVYPPIDETKDIKSYNCAGLAFRTYEYTSRNETKSALSKFRKLTSCKDQCEPCEVKCWYWEYDVHIENGYGKKVDMPGFKNRIDFHIVCGQSSCSSGSDPEEVSSKNGPGQIEKGKPDDFFFTDPNAPIPGYGIPLSLENMRIIRNILNEKSCFCTPVSGLPKPKG